MSKKQINLKKYLTKTNILITFGFVIALIPVLRYENNAISVSNYNIISSKLPSAFSGFRILQISDLHNASFGNNNLKLINIIKEQNPDIIVVTGDLVDSRRTNIPVGLNFMEQAVAICPTYYVTGNHEIRFYSDYLLMRTEMERMGVTVLDEYTPSTISHNNEVIQIIGINDVSLDHKKLNAKSKKIKSQEINTLHDKNLYTILLSHRPNLFNEYVENNIDLAFCGHVHGGQIRLPIVGGLVGPEHFILPKYDNGVFTQNSTSMVVSRGLGNSLFPFRINNRPEVVVTTLSN